MSTLKELLNKHCPDGVEWKKLGEVCNVQSGGTPLKTKVEYWENGNIKWLGSGVCKNKKTVDEITDYISELGLTKSSAKLMKENTTLIALVGTTIGKVAFLPFEAAINQNIAGIYPIDTKILNPSFVYYICTTYYKDFISLGNGKLTMANLSFVRNLKIPVPPIEVQKEIVRILDTFTKYQDLLNRELELRKKQYEYYRDKLLTFNDNVEWKIINEVIISLNTGLNPRQFFRLNTDDAKNYYVTIRELQNNTIKFSEKTDKINDEALKLCNKRSNLEVGDVLFSGTGTIGETAIIDKFPNNWNIKEGIYSIKPNKSFLVPKFLMYLLKSSYIRDIYLAKADGGTVKSVPMKEMRNLKIPIPPLEEQERIVNILDKFDALCNDMCNDITKGLPAEIELRKKQYEYYRDKLLTFKEKKK